MSCVFFVCLAIFGCSESGLHSLQDEQGGEESLPERPLDTGEVWTDSPPPGDTETDTGEPVETGPPPHDPEICSVDTMVHMVGSGPMDCPDDYAAFMMDDGNGPNFVCCPLPATDILSEMSGLERGASCGEDEVITGFTSEYAYRCTAINLDRYQVTAPEEPCYFGSGSSGGSGVPGCTDHPHTWDVLQQNLFGSDGCSGSPYGALFVSQTDKDCEDMRAVQVRYNGTVEGDPPAGTPVEMFVD